MRGVNSILSKQRQTRRRRGMSIVYASIAMPVMFGFASLAMDYGRVQLVKTELRTALDAAARYGAKGYANHDQAYARANTAAQDNTVNGQTFGLASSEVEVGYWNESTRTFLPNAEPSNAVRVNKSLQVPLAMGAAIGMPTCTIRASSVAKCIPVSIVGLESIDFKNNAFVASYDSSSTTNPTQSNSSPQTSLVSNGYVGGKNNGTIKGDIFLGPDATFDDQGKWDITGAVTTMADEAPMPTVPAFSPSGGNPGGISQLGYTKNGTAALPGGTYWFNDLIVLGTLTFTGPTTIYVDGNVYFEGGDGYGIRAYQDIPSNLRIIQTGNNRTFTLNNNGDITAVIIAPQADFEANNNVIFRGACVFRTIDCKNNAEWYFDESAGEVASLAIVQ